MWCGGQGASSVHVKTTRDTCPIQVLPGVQQEENRREPPVPPFTCGVSTRCTDSCSPALTTGLPFFSADGRGGANRKPCEPLPVSQAHCPGARPSASAVLSAPGPVGQGSRSWAGSSAFNPCSQSIISSRKPGHSTAPTAHPQ